MFKLLNLAKEAAKAASLKILAIYQQENIDFLNKGDSSPVTQADLIAHKIIKDHLKDSKIPILSEEENVSYSERKNWKRFWLVDPLDGTKDFLARNNEFTVNIALIEDGKAILGVVMAPALNQIWYASDGLGAWTEYKGVTNAISANHNFQSGTRMLTSNFHDSDYSSDFAALNNITHTIAVGSSLKLIRIAESLAEIYPRFVGTSEWDIAASEAILRLAGGQLKAINGATIKYNSESLRNPFFIAWRPPLKWEHIKLPSNICQI